LLANEFSLRPFDVADIEKVNGKWLFSGTPSGLAYLTYLHSHGFPTMAAYTTQSNQLIGFLICNSEMNLAAAYVDPDYRGRHLFHSMAFEWCQEMAALGQTLTFAFVSEQNLASLKSLERLGGEEVDGWRVSYVLFLPKKCEPEDPLLLWYQRINQLKPIKSSKT
jgi:RimJ/RimL family protein N-acetyltransferase